MVRGFSWPMGIDLLLNWIWWGGLSPTAEFFLNSSGLKSVWCFIKRSPWLHWPRRRWTRRSGSSSVRQRWTRTSAKPSTTTVVVFDITMHDELEAAQPCTSARSLPWLRTGSATPTTGCRLKGLGVRHHVRVTRSVCCLTASTRPRWTRRDRRTPSSSSHNARSSSVQGLARQSSQPVVGGRRGWLHTRREEALVAWAVLEREKTYAVNFSPTSWRSSKDLFVEHLFCYFIKIVKLETTSPFFKLSCWNWRGLTYHF
jgi:hypothetical protein